MKLVVVFLKHLGECWFPCTFCRWKWNAGFEEIAEEFQLCSVWAEMAVVALRQFFTFYELHLMYPLVNPWPHPFSGGLVRQGREGEIHQRFWSLATRKLVRMRGRLSTTWWRGGAYNGRKGEGRAAWLVAGKGSSCWAPLLSNLMALFPVFLREDNCESKLAGPGGGSGPGWLGNSDGGWTSFL